MPISNPQPRGAQEFTASGNFTVPAGVTTVFVSGCAAGGGSLNDNTNSSFSSGSPGQAVIRKPMTVTPGAVLPVVIGNGGAICTNYTTDPRGGDTTFNGLTLKGGVANTVQVGGIASKAADAKVAPFSGWVGSYNGATPPTQLGYGQGGDVRGGGQTGSGGYLLIEW